MTTFTASKTDADKAAIRAKIAKLLRLKDSANANEAANAAAFVEKLCAEHGIDPDAIDANEEESLAATHWVIFERANNDYGLALLLNAVATFYEGKIVHSTRSGKHSWTVFAAEGNKIRIECYFDYLVETMRKLRNAKRRELMERDGYLPRGFEGNFAKGFASAIHERLKELKSERAAQQVVSNGPGLVLLRRASIAKANALELRDRMFPRLSKGRRATFGGDGAALGRQAASGVGLSQQVRAGGPRALPAGR